VKARPVFSSKEPTIRARVVPSAQRVQAIPLTLAPWMTNS
jgi:hypothetical protein